MTVRVHTKREREREEVNSTWLPARLQVFVLLCHVDRFDIAFDSLWIQTRLLACAVCIQAVLTIFGRPQGYANVLS